MITPHHQRLLIAFLDSTIDCYISMHNAKVYVQGENLKKVVYKDVLENMSNVRSCQI